MENNLCIYCGSAAGADTRFAESAATVGRLIAERGFGTVYGGGRVGLMGIVADAVLAAGGKVIGVIPEAMVVKEFAHRGLTELHVVRDMHERKAMMANRSSAFLTLPGGIGTYEEFFETLSWATLGLHQKPMGILDVDGYFSSLFTLLEKAVVEQFAHPSHLDLLIRSTDIESLIDNLMARSAPIGVGSQIDLSSI
jgi:uncharacterized protein (TIGR00730 family)